MGKNGDPPPPRPPRQGQQPTISSPSTTDADNRDKPIIQTINTNSNTNTENMGGNGNTGKVRGSNRQDECISLVIVTTLQSVVKTALASVNVHDVLIVVLRENAAVVLNNERPSAICGTITSNENKLVECLKKDAAFEAVVLKKDGGECQVRVRYAG